MDAAPVPTIDPDTLSFDLQSAYRISEETARHDARTLFWAADRFSHDQASDACAREQRFESRQRIAIELDRRGIPVRDPRLPSSYPGRR